MQTLANKNGRFYLLAVSILVITLLAFTMKISFAHATSVRHQQMRLQEIESLSEERIRLDSEYLTNQKQIEKLQQANAEIKKQQTTLANSAKQKRIEFVHDFGCEAMT